MNADQLDVEILVDALVMIALPYSRLCDGFGVWLTDEEHVPLGAWDGTGCLVWDVGASLHIGG